MSTLARMETANSMFALSRFRKFKKSRSCHNIIPREGTTSHRLARWPASAICSPASRSEELGKRVFFIVVIGRGLHLCRCRRGETKFHQIGFEPHISGVQLAYRWVALCERVALRGRSFVCVRPSRAMSLRHSRISA
jgi:hypothetical protein